MIEGKASGLTSLLLDLQKKITDTQLRSLFPEENPGSIRTSLAKAAQILSTIEKRTYRKDDISVVATKLDNTKAKHDLTIFTDGASRGNPGEAGAGIYIIDDQGLEICGEGFYLGKCTNNMAEYQALLLGLSEAKKLGGKNISVNLDSELIVKQINGQYRVKDAKLKPLFEKAIKQLKGFRKYVVNHIPRAENHRADQLANEGIDTKRMLPS